jgi:dGTPase
MSHRPDNAPHLAPYAVSDLACLGRVYPEAHQGEDSPFDFDLHRIVHCAAFRRLMHKTQVFVTDQGDHFRTRLTHTLEVAAIARRLARSLRLNARLAETIALAHDLGHPPFGHAGESALAERMAEHGGFEHNLQSLRIVDYLEHPYPAYRGLNLTFEVRECLIKHRTRYDHPPEGVGNTEDLRRLLVVGPMPPLEGQVANLADTLAYTLHDIEDGIGEGLLTEELLRQSALWREAADPIRSSHADRPLHAIRRPVLDALASRLIEDAVAESTGRLQAAAVADVSTVRRHEGELIGLSDSLHQSVAGLQESLAQWVYRNPRVARMDFQAKTLINELFQVYLSEPARLPERFRGRLSEQGLPRVICDYVAGMTDRFCQQEHHRLYGPFRFD